MHWWAWLIVGLGAWSLTVTVGTVAWVLLIRRAAAAREEASKLTPRMSFQSSNAADPGPDWPEMPGYY